jgi:Ca2+-binding RTX toxin-like protein
MMLIGNWSAGLFGNSFDTYIIGNSGKNRLDGGGGSDTLEGGAGADSFQMNEGNGHDLVTDFKVGEDRCNFVNWGALLDLEDVLEHATEINDGILIEQGEDSIFLAGVALEELTARDFIYGWPE